MNAWAFLMPNLVVWCQVAKLERDGDGKAWVLRPEFAPGSNQ